MRMDAVIFDMDGVVVDSERHWKSAEGFFLQSLVGRWSDDDQARITGLSIHDVYRLLVSEYGLNQPKEQFLAHYNGIAAGIYGQQVSLTEGFLDLLAALNESRIPVALASSSTMGWIDIMLKRFGLRPAFTAVVSADEVSGGEGKPSPAIYFLTAGRLGVPAEKCVVVEDSRNGVLSAKRAGMFCIGFLNGYNHDQDLSSADITVNSFHELNVESLRELYRSATGGTAHGGGHKV